MWTTDLATDLADGPPRSVTKHLATPSAKLVQITLRDGTVLPDHSARFPITIQCVAGAGTLDMQPEPVPLTPGTLVHLDAGVVHAVTPTPAVSVLVTFFRGTAP